MKKLCLVVVLTFFGFTAIQAQTNVKFGATGGLLANNTNLDISVLGIDIANIDAINEIGFYVGGFADIELSEKFHVQPELIYGSAKDIGFVFLPIIGKYYITEKFNAQLGPQFSYSTNLKNIKESIRDIDNVLGTNTNLDDVLRTTGVDLAFGGGYDITEQFSVQARYSVELTNRYTGPIDSSLKVRSNNLMVGVTYSFN